MADGEKLFHDSFNVSKNIDMRCVCIYVWYTMEGKKERVMSYYKRYM